MGQRQWRYSGNRKKALQYYKPGITKEELIERSGLSDSQLKIVAKNENLTFAPSPFRIMRFKDEVIELRRQGKSGKQVAAQTGLTLRQVHYLWKQYLPPEEKVARHTDDQVLQAIKDHYTPGITMKQLLTGVSEDYPHITLGRVRSLCKKYGYELAKRENIPVQQKNDAIALLKDPELSLKDISILTELTYPQVLLIKSRHEKGTDRRKKKTIKK